MDGMKVFGVITKKFEPKPADPLSRMLNSPAVYVIYEKPRSDQPDYYLTALRIVKETIEYVLAQPDRQKFFLRWSS